MSAKKFLEVVEKSGLLEERDIGDLRRQLKETKGKVTVESMAKYLVDKGCLTKFQATKLVGQVTSDEEEPPKKKSSPAPAKKNDDDDSLDLAPFDDDEAEPAPKTSKPTELTPVADEPEIMAEAADGLTPIEDAKGGLTWIGQKPADLGGLTPLPDEPDSHDPFGGPMLTEVASADPFSAAQGNMQTAAHQPYVLKKKDQRWDTKLILGGITALLVLLLLGAGLLWNFLAVPAVALFDAAEKAYREGAYTDAKDRFEGFLEQYPSDENASKARVRVLLVRLRQDAGDPERGLETAKEVLPLMSKEADADMGREELPGLLPQIPEGFVSKAKQAKDTKTREELLAKAKQAMELVNDPENIPTSRRNSILPQLNRINEDIGLIERTIAQENELASSIAAIGAAEAAGDTVKAYELHNALLRNYPAVRDNPELREAVGKIAARERSLVKVVNNAVASLTQEEARTSDFRVVLANRVGGGGEMNPQNPVAAVLAAGSVYGIDSVGGQMLWRRFVGHSSRAHPIRVSNEPDSDVLLIDSQRRELVRVKARTGELVWRFPIGESSSDPCVAGTRIYLATESGKVLEVDGATGESTRHVAIPQKLSLAPAATSDQPYIFQIGEHSNIYVLNRNSLACEDVIYLGHKAGTVAVPPLLLMGHVFVAENIANNALVHAFKVRNEGDGQKIFPTQNAIRTNGRILVPLAVYNRRLLLVTDRREIRVFDVDRTKTDNSVTPTGSLPAQPTEPVLGYPLTDGMTLWVADDRLTKYTVQVARKEFTRDPAVTVAGDQFVAPLQLFGNTLVHVRRMAGSTGVTVACIHVDNPRQFLWQTHLGVPAGRIAVNPSTNEIMAISSGASLYQINAEVLKAGYSDTPQLTVAGNSKVAFTQPIDFQDGKVAFFNPEDHRQLLVYDPAAAGSRLKIITLQLPEGRVSATPVAFNGGLLAAHETGVVSLLQTSDGSRQLLPFQPKLEPNEKIEWRRPAVLSSATPEFVIADNRQNIYRVGIKDQPDPHLAEVASNRLEVELASGLASAGDTIYGFVRANTGDLIIAISASELKVVKEFDLKGSRVTWGPEQVGDTVMVVTDEKELRCFGADQNELWPKPAVMHGQPAGKPLIEEGHFVFAAIPGTVWRIARATGEEVAKTELGEPLGAGPVAFRGRLLLCGNDGSLHVISLPAAATTTATGG